MSAKKTLFICRANIGRSQVAMTLYNSKYPGMAESAGTQVDEPGQKLVDRPGANVVVGVMAERGYDMRNNPRRQLFAEMLDTFDQVVVLAESAAIPDYLRNYPNAIFWTVDDTRSQSSEIVRRICDDIKKKVGEL